MEKKVPYAKDTLRSFSISHLEWKVYFHARVFYGGKFLLKVVFRIATRHCSKHVQAIIQKTC